MWTGRGNDHALARSALYVLYIVLACAIGCLGQFVVIFAVIWFLSAFCPWNIEVATAAIGTSHWKESTMATQ